MAVYAMAGSLHAEFSGADEAAYVVSGIMVREYLAGAMWQGVPPMTFAQEYYAQYPKVAIGHWPPVYFFVQGVWYLLAGVSRVSVLVLSAALSSIFATFTVLLCRRESLRWSLAITAGVTAALLPLTLQSLLEIGSDVIASIGILGTALCCERWIADRSARNSALLAVVGALAVLTKGSAFVLVLAAPMALLTTTRSVSWLWSRESWRVIIIGGLIALPWYLMARGWVIDEIVPGAPRSITHAVEAAAVQNARALLVLGSVLLLPLALVSLRSGWYRRAPVMAMLPLATWLFLSFLSPHREVRLFLHVVPLLVFAGAVAANMLVPKAPELVLVAALAVAHVPWSAFTKPKVGFVPAVAWIQHNRPRGGDRILVTANSSGEGAFISELALREPRPLRTVARASKVFQSSGWMGDGFQLHAKSADDVERLLAANEISLVVRHSATSASAAAYEESLDEALRSWRLLREFGEVRVYDRPTQR
ncbi:MAG: glycosyltransferase family 39 protein [Gemmatimonadaceae bacterium]|nr:glycosyltransferase family 39 protein [Gemmatimonadaceae bacterium]